MDERSFAARGNDGNPGMTATERLCEFEGVRTDSGTGRTVAGYDCESVPLSLAVPELIAQCTDVDPIALPPMYDCVDVDGLERIINERAGCDVTVSFRYAGHAVEIDAERLAVQPTG